MLPNETGTNRDLTIVLIIMGLIIFLYFSRISVFFFNLIEIISVIHNVSSKNKIQKIKVE